MKQKHIFLVEIMHDEDENLISTKVVQGPLKRDFGTYYVFDNNGNDYWVSKEIFKKFEVVKKSDVYERYEKPTVTYTMGFLWEDGVDEQYVQNMADECQRRCKSPIIDRLNEIRNEIGHSIEKLLKAKTYVKI